MTGILKQVNRSNGGLPKYPISGAVMLGDTSIQGDRCGKPFIHGGPTKAVLMISAELIDALAARGFPIYYGALGENLTVSGLDPHKWRGGQRYRVGSDAVIELTTLRTPCRTLDVYGPGAIQAELYDKLCEAGDTGSPRWAHGGFYARVVETGLIVAGNPVVLQSDVA